MKSKRSLKHILNLSAKFLAISFAISQVAKANESYEIPKDELAQESVYPVFDKPYSVKSRNVVTEKKIDLGVFYGMALTEPIHNVSKLGLNVNYHMSEDYSLGLLYAKNSTGFTSYAKNLEDTYDLDFKRSPYPTDTLMLDWNIKAYYGKMSLTKETVMNTTLYGSLAGGIVKYIHKSYPAIAAGLGTRFYFTNQFSLKADLRLYAHSAPIPFYGQKPGSSKSLKIADQAPDYSDFRERLTYTTNLDIGLNWLF